MLVYPFLTRTTTNNFPVVLGPTKIRCTKNASLITSIYNHLTSSKQALQWDESLLQEGVKIWIFLSQLDISANSERNEWFWWTWKHVTVRKGWISDNNISRKWKHEASNIRIILSSCRYFRGQSFLKILWNYDWCVSWMILPTLTVRSDLTWLKQMSPLERDVFLTIISEGSEAWRMKPQDIILPNWRCFDPWTKLLKISWTALSKRKEWFNLTWTHVTVRKEMDFWQ